MTERKHTELPWWSDGIAIDSALGNIGVVNLARQSEEDCKFISHACNNHYALIEALEECISVMAKNIYPKPDAPDDHPWRVLERARATLKQANGESDEN